MLRNNNREPSIKKTSLSNKSEITNKFDDKQFYRRRKLMSKYIDRERVSRTPNLALHKRSPRQSETNQIQITAEGIMTTIKTKMLKEAYLALKRLLHFRPKLLIMRSIWKSLNICSFEVKLYKCAANYLNKMQLTRTHNNGFKDSAPYPMLFIRRSQKAHWFEVKYNSSKLHNLHWNKLKHNQVQNKVEMQKVENNNR